MIASKADQQEPSELRVSSRIRRVAASGGTVFEKQYVVDDWGGTGDVIRRRAERENHLLRVLSDSGLFTRRLGVVQIAYSDPTEAIIATRQVPGVTLATMLRTNHRVGQLLPWYLAGLWLRRFHSLPVPAEAFKQSSSRESADLEEYIELRVRSLGEYGYRWPAPAVKQRLRAVVIQLRNAVSAADREPVWVHADYSPGNIIWDGCRLTPIDFAMARAGTCLDDATYLIHRLEMQRVYRPWIQLPITSYRHAILRGLGVPNAMDTPAYQLLMLRHLVCRLHTYVRRPPRNLRQSFHDRWVRAVLRKRIVDSVHELERRWQ